MEISVWRWLSQKEINLSICILKQIRKEVTCLVKAHRVVCLNFMMSLLHYHPSKQQTTFGTSGPLLLKVDLSFKIESSSFWILQWEPPAPTTRNHYPHLPTGVLSPNLPQSSQLCSKLSPTFAGGLRSFPAEKAARQTSRFEVKRKQLGQNPRENQTLSVGEISGWDLTEL